MGWAFPPPGAVRLVGHKVRREQIETAAVVTAPQLHKVCAISNTSVLPMTTIMFGSSGWPTMWSTTFTQPAGIRANPYAALLEAVSENRVPHGGMASCGFCHGVMNTDNMSILGLTIDWTISIF
jgi:uncharacterized protein YdiU (UPF0061 family)